MPIGPISLWPSTTWPILERGRPARGGARAGAGGGGSLPRAGGQGARCLSARSGMALNNLATSLSEVGQREAALAPAQEAAALYRELAAKAPDAYRPDLAMALNNLANRLSEVGQREAALAPAQEAVAIRRELAAKAPDAYRPDLAMALNNLANRLSEVGQREAALAPAQEAVAICPRAGGQGARCLSARSRHGPQQPGHSLERGRPARGGARAGAGGGCDPPRAGGQGARYLSARSRWIADGLANCLEAAGQREAALERNCERSRTSPRAFWPCQQPSCTGRCRCARIPGRCEKLGREPDMELLGPILEVLQRMQEGPADDEEGGGQ